MTCGKLMKFKCFSVHKYVLNTAMAIYLLLLAAAFALGQRPRGPQSLNYLPSAPLWKTSANLCSTDEELSELCFQEWGGRPGLEPLTGLCWVVSAPSGWSCLICNRRRLAWSLSIASFQLWLSLVYQDSSVFGGPQAASGAEGQRSCLKQSHGDQGVMWAHRAPSWTQNWGASVSGQSRSENWPPPGFRSRWFRPLSCVLVS